MPHLDLPNHSEFKPLPTTTPSLVKQATDWLKHEMAKREFNHPTAHLSISDIVNDSEDLIAQLMSGKWQNKPLTFDVMPDYHKSASALIREPITGMILAVSRKDDHTSFTLPGGKIDPGESFQQCAVRELLEETGYQFTPSLSYGEDLDGYLNERLVIEELHGDPTRPGKLYYCKIYNLPSDAIEKVQEPEKGGGIVQWVRPEVLIAGRFSELNKLAFAKLGISWKKS